MSASDFKNQGNQAFKEKKFAEAAVLYGKAIELAPNDHVLYSNRSGAYASLEQYQQALEDADKCIQLNSSFAKGYQRKGLALFYLNKLEDSVAAYKKGLEIEPNNQIIREGLQAAEEKIQSEFHLPTHSPFENNAKLATLHQILINDQRTKSFANESSFVQLLQLLLTNPKIAYQYMQNDPRLQLALQVILENPEAQKIFFSEFAGKMGKNDQNEEQPQQTQQQSQPEPPKPQEKHHEEKKKEEKPVPQNKKMEEEVQPSEQAKNEGNEFYKQKKFAEALQSYEKAIELNPLEPLYYNNKAACFIETKRYEDAIVACDDGLKIMSDNEIKNYTKTAKLLARRAKALQLLDRLQEAVQFYEKSLLEDNNQNVRDDLRKVQKEIKDREIQAYINPEIAEQHNTKGGELFKSGQFPAALKEYEEAIRRSPKEAKYFCNKATCLMKLMGFNEAVRDLDKCLEIDPKYLKAYIKKGSCHTALKEYQKAKDIYEKGLKLDPKNEEIKQSLEKVTMLVFGSAGETEEEQQNRAKRAMQDPEIQQILREPEIINLLQDMQKGSQTAMKTLQTNKDMAAKVEKLIAAGVLKVG